MNRAGTSKARRPRTPDAPRPAWRNALLWVLAPLGIFGLAALSAAFRIEGLSLSIWWPAAGAGLWLALRVRREHRLYVLPIVYVINAAVNFTVSGVPLGMAALYGAWNTIELVIALSLLGAWRSDFRLTGLASAIRFVAAISVAAIVLGILAGVSGVLLQGQEYFGPATIASASHSAAMTLIAPLAVLPRHLASDEDVHPLEIAAQSVITLTAIAVAFGPGGLAPLSFLVIAGLAWGALRFRIEFAFIQALATAGLVIALTVGFDGAFAEAAGGDPVGTAALTLPFLAATGIFTVMLTLARHESRENAQLAVAAAEAAERGAQERASLLGMRLDLDRQREDFIASTSHELRTPVTNLVGYSELLAETDLPEPADHWVAAVQRSAARLNALLDDLLAASHPSREHIGAAEDVLVDDLLAETRSAHHPDAEARDITIGLGEPTGLTVHANPIDVRRALWNLVSNAVKFTHDGGEVRLFAEDAGDRVRICVADDGPGMSGESLTYAFDRFYRSADAEARSTAGLGLGLPIAQELAHRNGGDIELSSRFGQGLRAVLVLPSGRH